MKILLLIIGGSLGTLLRYGAYTLTGPTSVTFPIKTFAVNTIGCFLIGFFVQSFGVDSRYFSSEFKLLFMTGFCGAFTTFSTFIFEAHDLLQHQKFVHAFAYVLLSVTLGFLALYLGLMASKLILSR